MPGKKDEIAIEMTDMSQHSQKTDDQGPKTGDDAPKTETEKVEETLETVEYTLEEFLGGDADGGPEEPAAEEPTAEEPAAQELAGDSSGLGGGDGEEGEKEKNKDKEKEKGNEPPLPDAPDFYILKLILHFISPMLFPEIEKYHQALAERADKIAQMEAQQEKAAQDKANAEAEKKAQKELDEARHKEMLEAIKANAPKKDEPKIEGQKPEGPTEANPTEMQFGKDTRKVHEAEADKKDLDVIEEVDESLEDDAEELEDDAEPVDVDPEALDKPVTSAQADTSQAQKEEKVKKKEEPKVEAKAKTIAEQLQAQKPEEKAPQGGKQAPDKDPFHKKGVPTPKEARDRNKELMEGLGKAQQDLEASGKKKFAPEKAQDLRHDMAEMVYNKSMMDLMAKYQGGPLEDVGRDMYTKGMNPDVKEKQIQSMLKDPKFSALLDRKLGNIPDMMKDGTGMDDSLLRDFKSLKVTEKAAEANSQELQKQRAAGLTFLDGQSKEQQQQMGGI